MFDFQHYFKKEPNILAFTPITDNHDNHVIKTSIRLIKVSVDLPYLVIL